MSNTRQIAFNTTVQLLGKVVTAATSILIIAYLTRYLGVAGYGDYATIFAYLGIFGVLVDLGLFVTTVRSIAKDPGRERTILGNMLGLRISLGLIVFALAGLIAWALPYSAVVTIGIGIAAISQFLISLNQVPLSSFQARLTMQKATFSDIIGRLVILGLVIWFISTGLGFLYIIAAVTIGSAVVFTMNMIMSQWVAPIKPEFDLRVWKEMLLLALPMGVVIILAAIYFRIDTVMLSVMKGSFDVGIYGAPYKVLEVFLAVPSIFMSSVLPVITRALADDHKQARVIFRKAFDFLALSALPLMVGSVVVATPLMVFLAGSEFALSGPVLKILIFAMGASFLNAAMIYTIVAANEQRRLVVPYILATAFNVVANLLVIPHFSYIGAATTTVITEVIVLVVSARIVYQHLQLNPTFSVFGRALLASIVMGLAIFYLDLHVIWLALIGAVLYISLIFITRAVTRENLRQILPKVDRK